VNKLRALARYGLPFIVSGGLLAFLLSRFDMLAALSKLTAESALVMVPSLLAYGAASLYLEAQCLRRVFASSERPIDAWTGARVRAASYLFALLHYAVGVSVMAMLLRRRTGLSLADAGGAVAFISVLDLGILLSLGALVLVDDPFSQGALMLMAIGGIAGGLTLLRSPKDLGRIEALRSLALFRAPRTTPLRPMFELLALRIVFIAAFVGIVGASLVAFGVRVPPAPLVVGVVGVAVVAALPIALAGLGTGQAAFLFLFQDYGDAATLLACSLTLSAGLISLRGAMGLFFARELTREAMEAAREVQI
jgi:uncharacterized membrane protein YbhN (UPF0104 family)